MDIWKLIKDVDYYGFKAKRYVVLTLLIVGAPLGIAFILLGGDASFDFNCHFSNYPLVGDMKTDCTVSSRDGIARSFKDRVNLSCVDLPRGISCNFGKTEVGPPYGEIPLQIVASSDAKKGEYYIKVLAVSGDMKRDSSVYIEIR